MLNHNFLKQFKKDNLICLIILIIVFILDRISKIKMESQGTLNMVFLLSESTLKSYHAIFVCQSQG